jgi:hypothetical protein
MKALCNKLKYFKQHTYSEIQTDEQNCWYEIADGFFKRLSQNLQFNCSFVRETLNFLRMVKIKLSPYGTDVSTCVTRDFFCVPCSACYL